MVTVGFKLPESEFQLEETLNLQSLNQGSQTITCFKSFLMVELINNQFKLIKMNQVYTISHFI